MITLYGMSSPNVRKVLIALEEMGLAYEPRHVSVFRGAQFTPEILALNPMAKVPILIDPDGPHKASRSSNPVRSCSIWPKAMARTFCRHHGPARYTVLKWLFMQVASMGPALGNHSHFRQIGRRQRICRRSLQADGRAELPRA